MTHRRRRDGMSCANVTPAALFASARVRIALCAGTASGGPASTGSSSVWCPSPKPRPDELAVDPSALRSGGRASEVRTRISDVNAYPTVAAMPSASPRPSPCWCPSCCHEKERHAQATPACDQPSPSGASDDQPDRGLAWLEERFAQDPKLRRRIQRVLAALRRAEVQPPVRRRRAQ